MSAVPAEDDRAARALAERLRQAGLLHQPVAGVDGPALLIGGRRVLNFASTNYLGLNRHPFVKAAVADTVGSWGVALSMPRLLADDSLSRKLEQRIAALVGRQSALLFPSTTAIAVDLLPRLARPGAVLLLDRWAYPISVEGARLAQAQGARLRFFPHNDLATLEELLRKEQPAPTRTIVCDGVYPGDGSAAPLAAFAEMARRHKATLYVDDAHGLGVLGAAPDARRPYGTGGGGTTLYAGVTDPNIILAGSMSKAFGVPVSFVAGSATRIDVLRSTAGSVIHSSPPSLPTLAAALAVLQIHAALGQLARRRLCQNVILLRRALIAVCHPPAFSHLFPIQTLHFRERQAAFQSARRLRAAGIWPVLQFAPADNPAGAALRFVLSAYHEPVHIEKLGMCLRGSPT